MWRSITGKDRTTLEDAFAALVSLVAGLDEEQRRAAQDGLSEDELAVFDLIQNGGLTKAERERVKEASRALLVSLKAVLAPMARGFTENTQTQAEVETLVLDNLYRDLPRARDGCALPGVHCHGPVMDSITTAPVDDEPLTDEEDRALRRADAWLAQNGGQGIPHEEVLGEFGLSMEDFPLG